MFLIFSLLSENTPITLMHPFRISWHLIANLRCSLWESDNGKAKRASVSHTGREGEGNELGVARAALICTAVCTLMAEKRRQTDRQRATRTETKSHPPPYFSPPSAPDRKHTASAAPLTGHNSRSFARMYLISISAQCLVSSVLWL